MVRRYFWGILLLLGCVIAACAGGSGSSGFDVSSENAAITRALDEAHCVTRKSLTICPADQTSATPPATPPPGVTPTASTTPTPSTQTPTPPVPAQQIDTGVDPRTPLTCAQLDATNGCTFFVPFAPLGFSPAAIFRVAVRELHPTSRWSIGATPERNGPADAPNFDAVVSVHVPVDDARSTVAVQLAVLVFASPVANVPAEVDELADSGATEAFITTELTLQLP